MDGVAGTEKTNARRFLVEDGGRYVRRNSSGVVEMTYHTPQNLVFVAGDADPDAITGSFGGTADAVA